MRLSLVDGVGPDRRRLLDRFGEPGNVLAAAPSDLREVEGVGPKLTERIVRAGDEIDAEAEIAFCRTQGIASSPRPTPNIPAPSVKFPTRRACSSFAARSGRPTPWPSALSARGTARTTDCGRPSGSPAASPAPG